MGTTSEGHSTSSRVMIPATVPSIKLHAQVPTASGLTAFAHYSCCASIVGLELRTGDSVSYQSYSGKELADFRLSLATGTSPGDRLRRGSNGALRPLAWQSRRQSSPLVAASRLPPAHPSL